MMNKEAHLTSALSFCAAQVHRFDRERFTTALFAPLPEREELMVLYAFNVELSLIRENIHEATAGLIRVHWWREVLSGLRDAEASAHPIAGPLLRLVREKHLPQAVLQTLLDAREKDLNPDAPEDLSELEAYAAETSGSLTELALAVLGSQAVAQVGRAIGTGVALTGLLRAIPSALGHGRLMLPERLLLEQGTSAEEVRAGKASRAAIAAVARRVGERAGQCLAEGRAMRTVPRRGIPALLPGVLASRHLRGLERAEWDVFDPRIARRSPMPLRLAFHALLGRF